jgi:NDP-sugar pyrophosphorylase family protein
MSEAPVPSVAILAGGLATRMRPITTTIPKAMIEVAGQPFIAHQLQLLSRQGVRRVVLCLGYLGEQVAAFVGDGGRFGIEAQVSYDGDRLLGTGGALRKALPLLGEQFFVLYGDSYLDIAYAPIAEAFAASGLDGLMTVFRNEGRWDTSNVLFESNRIVCYSKKDRLPQMRHIDYGLGLMKASVLARRGSDEPFDLADLYSELVASRRLAGFEVSRRFYEIGSPVGLAETEDYLARVRETER